MDDPQRDIEGVIRRLTQSAPAAQRETVDTYFTSNASFTHPLCRTGSFAGSRFLIRVIYRWYKIMSPTIHINIDSIAYDEANLLLYISMHQIFSIWLIPFHKSHVALTTVLQLKKDRCDNKYYIQSQNDLYQSNQVVRFFWFGGNTIIMLIQHFATLLCLLGAIIFSPVTYLEQQGAVDGVKEKKRREIRSVLAEQSSNGGMITAPALAQR